MDVRFRARSRSDFHPPHTEHRPPSQRWGEGKAREGEELLLSGSWDPMLGACSGSSGPLCFSAVVVEACGCTDPQRLCQSELHWLHWCWPLTHFPGQLGNEGVSGQVCAVQSEELPFKMLNLSEQSAAVGSLMHFPMSVMLVPC